MWKFGASLLAALLGLSACASPNGAVPLPLQPASSQAASFSRSFAGWLDIDPVAIIFKSGHSGGVRVRVWQHGYTGHFRAHNECPGIKVTVHRYVGRSAALFNVIPEGAGREKCIVIFSGSAGQRGSQALAIRVLRKNK